MGVVDTRLVGFRALMRASERIQEAYGQPGELSASRGELFLQASRLFSQGGTW